jgi:ribosome-binding protein aMBF1 (putative translation factor)
MRCELCSAKFGLLIKIVYQRVAMHICYTCLMRLRYADGRSG